MWILIFTSLFQFSVYTHRMPKKVLISLVLLALLGLAYFYLRPSSSIPPPKVYGDPMDAFNIPPKVNVEDKAKNLPNSASITLFDVTEGTSIGVSYSSAEEGIMYLFTQAQLSDPSGDDFYEGWIVEGTGEVKSTGVFYLKENGYENKYINKSKDEKNPIMARPEIPTIKPGTKIIITLETIRDDIPEAHVLEGTF